MNDEILKELLDQYLAGTITQKGRSELIGLMDQPGYREKLEMLLGETFRNDAFLIEEDPRLREEIQRWLKSRIAEDGIPKIPEHRATGKPGRFRFRSYAVAASVFLAAVAIWIIVQDRPGTKGGDSRPLASNDIEAPAISRATITLANGKTVFLDSANSGELALQGNIKLVKLPDGSIAYQTVNAEIVRQPQYNTVFNPRGSKVIDMVLSDGSRVWLNSGSSITFPVVFIENERKIAIDGEAYFEVSPLPELRSQPSQGSVAPGKMPFIVSKGDMQVEVLGTHFNVNAYSDEQEIKVTLLEGSVKVSNENNSRLLTPGQQASINEEIRIKGADLDEVMSWKDGIFLLDHTDLPAIMRQISRWYDVNVVYEGKIPGTLFGGGVSKDQPLSKILDALERYGLHFDLDGDTLRVK